MHPFSASLPSAGANPLGHKHVLVESALSMQILLPLQGLILQGTETVDGMFYYGFCPNAMYLTFLKMALYVKCFN